MDLHDTPGSSRRRGSALESAILSAAWDQLVAGGYAGFTFDAIAVRARTSKPVLYRRWSSRIELLTAAIGFQGARDRIPSPDTGALRGDVLTLLREVNARPDRVLALFSAMAGGLYEQADLTPTTIRQHYLPTGSTEMERIVTRAVTRGEIPDAAVGPEIAGIPVELLRIRIFMRLGSLRDDELVAIVDDVFLPIVSKPV